MTDKELKQILKKAYCVPQSESGNGFIKTHEKRTHQLIDIVRNEFRYMGMKSALAGIVLCTLFFATAKKGDENIMWITSSIIPMYSVIPMSHILRSERYGMCELEVASRFSLRFIRLIRMSLLGLFSGIVIIGSSIIMTSILKAGMIDIVMYMLFPYFVSVWGCLFITRKWHGSESNIGVPLVCIVSGFLPTVVRELQKVNFVSDYMYIVLLAVVMFETAKECTKYINERTYLLWNSY